MGFSLDVGKYIDKVFGWEDDPYGDWKKQQEYNSPANQIQRLIDAGMNPNLVYGNFSNTASSPIRARQGSNATVSYSPEPPNVDIQKEAIQAQIDLLGEREESVKLDNKLKELEYDYYKRNGTAPGVANLGQLVDKFINFVSNNPIANPWNPVFNVAGEIKGAYDIDSSAYNRPFPAVVEKKNNEDYSNFSYYGYTPRYRR